MVSLKYSHQRTVHKRLVRKIREILSDYEGGFYNRKYEVRQWLQLFEDEAAAFTKAPFQDEIAAWDFSTANYTSSGGIYSKSRWVPPVPPSYPSPQWSGLLPYPKQPMPDYTEPEFIYEDIAFYTEGILGVDPAGTSVDSEEIYRDAHVVDAFPGEWPKVDDSHSQRIYRPGKDPYSEDTHEPGTQ